MPDKHAKAMIILFLLFGPILTSCANRSFEPCSKNGHEYCLTNEWIFSESWSSCYLRGLSCTQGGCWDRAKDEFLRAISQREQDERWVRTYGMHRLPEYFPNRELGIAYFHLHDLSNAHHYLSVSLNQCESSKAKYYLNKVRKEKISLNQEDSYAPILTIHPYPLITSDPRFTLSGVAVDDTFVADLLIRNNRQKTLSLLEVSQPKAYSFQTPLLLEPGMNDILVKAVDLLGHQDEQRIKILLDQEGPMVFFSKMEVRDQTNPLLLTGFLYDPSEVTYLVLNQEKIELIPLANQEAHPVYYFSHLLSPEDLSTGFLAFETEDSLKNKTFGSLPCPRDIEPLAMAPFQTLTDAGPGPFITKISERRNPDSAPDPISIEISQVPKETMAEEICPRIVLQACTPMKEVRLNGQPILFFPGFSWEQFLDRLVLPHFREVKEGRLVFQRMIKLLEGENLIQLQIIDQAGKTWAKTISVFRKIRPIYRLEERWKVAIPLLSYVRLENPGEAKPKELTYQLIEAFVDQGRFQVIELENLPLVIDERNLSYYLGCPLLGLSPDSRLWIDTFILGYFHEAEDSITLSASLIDLETGEILATKDICEQVDPSVLRWQEGKREHNQQLCSLLAAKFKEHFPLCQGRITALGEHEITTGICRNDGLKKGMRLLVFREDNQGVGDLLILGEAKVKEVNQDSSLANLLEDSKDLASPQLKLNMEVITK